MQLLRQLRPFSHVWETKIPVVLSPNIFHLFHAAFWLSDAEVRAASAFMAARARCDVTVTSCTLALSDMRDRDGIWFQWFWLSRLREKAAELDLISVHPGLIKKTIWLQSEDVENPIWCCQSQLNLCASLYLSPVILPRLPFHLQPVWLGDTANRRRKKKKEEGGPLVCCALLGLCNQPPVIAHLKVQLY